MNFQVSAILLVGILVGLAATETRKTKISSVEDLRKLSLPQKLLLQAASKAKPDLFKGQLLKNSLFGNYETWYTDAIFNDLRTLLLQGQKLKGGEQLPELAYYEYFEFCFFWCFAFHISVTTEATKMSNLNDAVTSETVITPGTLKNTWHIDTFNWTSPKFLFNISTEDSFEVNYRDAEIYIKNLTATLNIEYQYIPELGIQVRKLYVDFDCSHFTFYMRELVEFYDGDYQFWDPYEYDYARYMASDWNFYYKARFQSDLKFRINCVLSNGRVDPIECNLPHFNYYDAIMYYKMNVIQLLQGFALGTQKQP